jgi:hypothetical protein
MHDHSCINNTHILRDSSVTKVTSYGLDDKGSISGTGRDFPLQTTSGAHSAPYTMGSRGFLLG